MSACECFVFLSLKKTNKKNIDFEKKGKDHDLGKNTSGSIIHSFTFASSNSAAYMIFMRAEGPSDDQQRPLDQTPLSVLFLDDDAGKISRMLLSLAQR